MLVRNVTRDDLDHALAKVNDLFSNNIDYRNCKYAGKARGGSDKFNVTLRAINSHGPGGKIAQSGRRIGGTVCWHAYGTFFDYLPSDCDIVVNGPGGRVIRKPGDQWVDYNIGSDWRPFKFSQACECGNDDDPIYDDRQRRFGYALDR